MGLDVTWPAGDGKVYVGNLDYKVTREELTEIMSKAGKVLTCEIPVDNKGRSRGHAMLCYDVSTVDVSILASLNALEINGRKILVREDRAPVGRRGKKNSDSTDVKEENRGKPQKPSTRRNRHRRSNRNGSKNGSGTSSKSPVSDTSNNEISFESTKKNNGQTRQSIIRPKIKLDEESAGTLVYFGNISWSAGNGEITEFVGGIECQIPTDKRGRSKGYALVQYADTALAAEAITKFNECEWLDRKMIARLFEFKKHNDAA